MYIVTGANGFIGSALVWELNQKGIVNIICVDTIPLAQRPAPLLGAQFNSFVETNQLWPFLDSISQPQDQVLGVFHLGACSSTTEMNVEFLYQNNTLYSQRLFEWCQKNKIPFIYASSAATYGAGEHGFSDQTDMTLLKPLNPYGDSKLAMDRWVLQTGPYQTPWYGLRFFNVFGPIESHKDSMGSLVYKAFHQVSATGKLGLFKSYRSEYADGCQLRDFVYVKDITRWIWELYQTTPASGIYNMGFGDPRTWLQLAQGVFSALNLPLQIQWLDMPENIKGQYQYFTSADMTSWKNAGLSAPQWSLEAGIQDYYKYYLVPGRNHFGNRIES